jgi:quinolinate synthase
MLFSTSRALPVVAVVRSFNGNARIQTCEVRPKMMPNAYSVTPDDYRSMSDEDLTARIHARRAALGDRVTILTHHYQRRAVVGLGDHQGDSYALCKIGAKASAEYIVFCGVHFMAESAVILARRDQKVFLPNPLAGCPMADMAAIDSVYGAWEELHHLLPGIKIVPISYMNSAADLKAFCGRNDGIICTSSNAEKAFTWGFERGEKLFFFPDEHLGRNTANKFGISKDQIFVWDFSSKPGNRDADAVRRARVIVWKGYCHVRFSSRIMCSRYGSNIPESKSWCIRSAQRMLWRLPTRWGQQVTSSSMSSSSSRGA